MKNRFLKSRLENLSKSRAARIIVLTGARQTGKTTLINASSLWIGLQEILDKPLLKSLILSNDPYVKPLAPGVAGGLGSGITTFFAPAYLC